MATATPGRTPARHEGAGEDHRRTSVLVTAGYAAIFLVSLLAPRSWHEDHAWFRVLVHVVIAGYVVVVLTRLGWWRRAGFRPAVSARSLLLAWPIALLVLLIALTTRYRAWEAGLLADVAVVYLVGFHEEAIFRGVLLRGFGSWGPLRAVLGSALVFAVLHGNNILTGDQGVADTVQQVLFALMVGVVYGAVRVRTTSLWLLVLLHGTTDLLGVLAQGTDAGSGGTGGSGGTTAGALVGLLIAAVPLVVYALWLLRPSRTAGWPAAEEAAPVTQPGTSRPVS